MHNIHGKMIYSYLQPMWHGITEPVALTMTAEDVLDIRFGGGFRIDLRPVTINMNGQDVETGDFGVVRTASPYEDTEVLFGYCTERYKPLQPRDVAREFDSKVIQYVETMGFLGHGEEMFISWAMPKFEVVAGDELEMYGIVKVGFDTTKGANLFTSIYRPVCANTLTFASNWAKQNTDGEGKGNIWKGRAVNENLLRDLGYWMAHVQENAIRQGKMLEALFGIMAQTPITDWEAQDILVEAFPEKEDVSQFYPKELKDSKAEKIELYNEGQAKVREGIFELFAGNGTAITPDAYGLVNSTTEYFCHYQPSKRPIATSAMFGARQKSSMAVVEAIHRRIS